MTEDKSELPPVVMEVLKEANQKVAEAPMRPLFSNEDSNEALIRQIRSLVGFSCVKRFTVDLADRDNPRITVEYVNRVPLEYIEFEYKISSPNGE